MADNYDATMKEPVLLPTTFPNVLVSANTGIAVGMASNICGFNLEEVCNTAIALIRDPECNLLETLPAPDFSTGGEILYDPLEMSEIYKTGRGSFKVRGKWRYVKEDNLIEIYEIPYTTTSEAIMDKVEELVKAGKIREINDMRDETDLNGLKLTIDLKRGADPEKLMQKLCRSTPLMDSYPCNFNILIAGMPRVMGVREILEEWTAWRSECIRRRVFFQLQKKKEKLHLLKGLQKILLDIDKAIAIIRNTELDAEVIPNLMIGFGIDQIQAEFVAEIRLRNINKEYILKRTAETGELEKQIDELEQTLNSTRRIRSIIIDELKKVAQKYGEPRRTSLVFETALALEDEPDETPDYPVSVFITKGGYLKKITPQSLRMSGEQKYKEGDSLHRKMELSNRAELLVFTSLCQAYKCKLSDFEDSKASVLGDFLPGKLGMDEGETVIDVLPAGDYSGWLLFFFENGKVAKVERSAYATKSNRRKLTGAFSDRSPVKTILVLPEEARIALYATDGRALIFSSALLSAKSTRSTQGVSVMSLKRKSLVDRAALLEETGIANHSRYAVRTLPAPGSPLKPEDAEEKQLSME